MGTDDDLKRLRDLYLALNRLDAILYDPRRCADELARARTLGPAQLRAELGRVGERLRLLTKAHAMRAPAGAK